MFPLRSYLAVAGFSEGWVGPIHSPLMLRRPRYRFFGQRFRNFPPWLLRRSTQHIGSEAARTETPQKNTTFVWKTGRTPFLRLRRLRFLRSPRAGGDIFFRKEQFTSGPGALTSGKNRPMGVLLPRRVFAETDAEKMHSAASLLGRGESAKSKFFLSTVGPYSNLGPARQPLLPVGPGAGRGNDGKPMGGPVITS